MTQHRLILKRSGETVRPEVGNYFNSGATLRRPRSVEGRAF